jgi:hypothetical protein
MGWKMEGNEKWDVYNVNILDAITHIEIGNTVKWVLIIPFHSLIRSVFDSIFCSVLCFSIHPVVCVYIQFFLSILKAIW